jgi:hypothetical protein
MQKIVYILLFLSAFYAKGQVVTSSNLPIIKINTNGKTIGLINKIAADISIIDNGKTENKVTDTPTYQGKIGIELRGSSSLELSPRTPYSAETRENDAITNKNIALLGMKKDNDWAFVAPYSDKTLIRDAFVYTLAKNIMPWAPDFRFAEVIVNDKYEGIYMVTEKIKYGKNRVNIDKVESVDIQGDELTGGYIFSFDKLKNGDKFFYSKYKLPGQQRFPEYIINAPKADNIKTEQLNYITKWVNNFETVMNSSKFDDPKSGYPKYINQASFVDYILLNELSKNIDAYRISTYFYKDKDSNDSLLHAGPVWDYNIALGNANYCNANNDIGWAMDFNNQCPNDYWTIPFWWQKLFEDPHFRSLLKTRWQELRKNEWTDTKLYGKIDSLQTSIGDAQKHHFARYDILGKTVWPNPQINYTYFGEINNLKNWLTKRANWLDGAFAKFLETEAVQNNQEVSIYPNPSHDKIIFAIKPKTSNANFEVKIYNLQGILLANSAFKTSSTWADKIEIDISNFTNGTYFYRILENTKPFTTGKFIKN